MVRSSDAGSKQYNLRVDGMICPFCVAMSEKASPIEAKPCRSFDDKDGRASFGHERGCCYPADIKEERLAGFIRIHHHLDLLCSAYRPR